MKRTERPEDRDLTKLPVWAQDYIHLLKSKVAAQAAKIEERSSQHPGTNVKINGYVSYPDFDLPPDSQIEFYMGTDTNSKWRETISVGHVRSDSHRTILRIQGGRTVRILPAASNSFDLMFDD
jgi:hypothetical protein